jgi:hypothetical protein
VNERQLLRLFPNASRATIAANADHTGPNPELERAAGDGPLATGQGQKEDSGRVHIRIVSVRKCLCDPDNLSPKWLLDSLRYCRVIRDDTPAAITLETTQRKAAKGEAEHTLVQIFTPEPQ